MQSNAKPVPVTVRYTLLKQSTNLIEKKFTFMAHNCVEVRIQAMQMFYAISIKNRRLDLTTKNY